MRGLKALVIGMGILIVIGLGTVVVTIANRVSSAGKAPRPDAATDVFAATLPVPAGARVVETTAGDGRLLVRLSLADGTGRIVVLDLATGRRLGAIDLPATGP